MNSSFASAKAEMVLEGTLLKQGSRSRHYWHERYVTLDANDTLRYFDKNKQKGMYHIPSLNDVQVSDLFVSSYHQREIFCMKLSWVDAFLSTDEASSYVTSNHEDSSHHYDGPPQSPPRRETDRNKSHLSPLQRLRKRRHGRSFSVGLRSVDEESLSARNGLHEETKSAGGNGAHVPNTVEFDSRHSLPDLPLPLDDTIHPQPLSDPSSPQEAIKHGQSAYDRQREEDLKYLRSQFLTTQKERRRQAKERIVQTGQIALATSAAVGLTIVTAGAGLLAGLVVLGGLGAAGGGVGAALSVLRRQKVRGEVVLASEVYEQAQLWKVCLDASTRSESVKRSTWGQLFASDGRTTNAALYPPTFKNEKMQYSRMSVTRDSSFRLGDGESDWQPLDGGWLSLLGVSAHGLRIYREVQSHLHERETYPAARPPMKASMILRTSPLDAFLCLMSYGRMKGRQMEHSKSEQKASFRILETIDDRTDIIHVVCRPLYLFPSWTMPRDLVLFRYWRLEQDGSYVICYESQQHPTCPPLPQFVRGEMHQVVTITPQKRSFQKRNPTAGGSCYECYMTTVTQVDPKGWVPVMPLPYLGDQAYSDAFTVASLAHMLDIRDAIDQDRFVSVTRNGSSIGNLPRGSPPAIVRNLSSESAEGEDLHDSSLNYDFSYSKRESTSILLQGAASFLASNPPPLSLEKWAEPDSNSFCVRGLNYKRDKLKINAGPSIGRLVATDVVRADEPIYSGFAIHPKERIQLAMQRERTMKERGEDCDIPPFTFIVNIVIPGTPVYHGVYYYAIDDMSKIDGSDGTPSSKLCSRFFFGESDDFRDKTFKLIPQIVQGPFIVRKAVGSTPAIIGRKLRQTYVRSDRFCEVIIDTFSSSVAHGVCSLSLGYAKTLVIDMGFVLEGHDEEYLPERLLGCVRMKHPHFGDSLRKVTKATAQRNTSITNPPKMQSSRSLLDCT